MAMTRITDTITGDVLALGEDIDVDEVFVQWAAPQLEHATEAELRDIFEVEHVELDDLTDEQWAAIVHRSLVATGRWRIDGVMVWMRRRPDPQDPTWPARHDGVAVQVAGEDQEQIFRAVRSWADLRAEVDDALQRIQLRHWEAQRAQLEVLAPVAEATHEVQRLEELLTAAREVRDAAIAAAVAAGCTRTRVAREAHITGQQVTNIVNARTTNHQA